MIDKMHDSMVHGPGYGHTTSDGHDQTPVTAPVRNFDHADPPEESIHPRTAYDVIEAHRQLVEWTDDELRQIPLLPAGSRLEPGATYVDLRDPARREFIATGEMQVPIDGLYVPRNEVDSRHWHRLLGVRIPEGVGHAQGGGPTG
jgi:hypothetical protein